MPDGRLRRLLLALPLALAAALFAAPAASAGLLFPEAGGSPNADSIKTLYIMVFVLALFIFAGVEGTLIWALVKYRARKGRTAAQIHGNTKLEIGWTVGAAVILVFITAFTFIKLGDIKEMILEQVKEFVVTKIITAGITWLIGLLNLAAAFIKACKLIYDVVMFFVNNAARIKGRRSARSSRSCRSR